MDRLNRASFRDIDITEGYLAEKQKMNADTTIFAVQNRFEDTGRFEAFKFNWKEGMENQPHYFWDSDIAKWMESAAYIYEKNKDERLKAKVNEVVDLIEENQCEDGYFNIWHTIIEPENKFKNREHHELYCLGHLIEAAVAISLYMNEDKLIAILDRYIDYVIDRFCVKKDVEFTTPGHEEIELALFRLYEIKPEKKYLDLAMFFLNERGKKTEFQWDWEKPSYNQSHAPVREQKEALGHSVRACYLYTGMADAARVTDDEEMLTACKALFDDIAEKKMYISGGIGSTNKGEAFTVGYDLPNDKAYTESCAGIALAFFANRMKDIDINSKYSDVIERLIYNGIMSSLSLDGKSFFYENPMEINLVDRDIYTASYDGCDLPKTQRSEVFGCSCCPPNITRFLATLGDYIFSYSPDTIYLHQFATMKAGVDGATISVKTDYPLSGKVAIHAEGMKGRTLAVRKPGWCKKADISATPEKTENGYLYFSVDCDDFNITADFAMTPVFCVSNTKTRANAEKVALMYGPVLYCAEGKDNDFTLWNTRIDTTAEPEKCYDEYYGEYIFTAKGKLTVGGNALYSDLSALRQEDVDVKLIPYCAFANRGETDMRVWFSY